MSMTEKAFLHVSNFLLQCIAQFNILLLFFTFFCTWLILNNLRKNVDIYSSQA